MTDERGYPHGLRVGDVVEVDGVEYRVAEVDGRRVSARAEPAVETVEVEIVQAPPPGSLAAQSREVDAAMRRFLDALGDALAPLLRMLARIGGRR